MATRDHCQVVEKRREPNEETLDTYQLHAGRYIETTSDARSSLVDDLIALVPRGSTVLELGSGPGRDAIDLEIAGLVVSRTDGAAAFVRRFQNAGIEARVLNVHAEDFGGPFDAVFANAVLLHVERSNLSGVLRVALRATRVGGVLVASFKRGAGAEWSHRKLDSPRHFTYWEETDLSSVVITAGWGDVRVWESTQPTSTERWITVTARNIPGSTK
jgi:SAM-dependent methyltransferase